MKTIIAISAVSNSGKTHGVVAAADHLCMLKGIGKFQVGKYQDFAYYEPKPHEAGMKKVLRRVELVAADGTVKNIGFASEGDSRWFVKHGLDTLTNSGTLELDVIVATCRHYGVTKNELKTWADAYGYDLIWTAPYHACDQKGATPDAVFTDRLNAVFAENMSNLINLLLL